MPIWNPDQYLKFMGERTQPSVDLAARIEIESPKSIIDIGCGPGNSTQVLHERWPESRLIGLDSSPEMIRKAETDMPEVKWIVGNATTFEFPEKYDLVFSNAALQWMPDHDSVIPKLFGIVNEGGALAVQVPANQDSPIQRAIVEVAEAPEWSKSLQGCEDLMTRHSVSYYYDALCEVSSRIDVWSTTYFHILHSHLELIEWYKGTGMRPFLERLPDDQLKHKFQDRVLDKCRDSYPPQRNGRILFPFKRIFFIAYRGQIGKD